MPPRIDFYILSEKTPQARERFACKLTEKAFVHGHRVFLVAQDPAQLEALDQLLWTFRDRAFLPHGREGDDEPILLGVDAPAAVGADTLVINLAADPPAGWQDYGRLAEIIDQQPSVVQGGRRRFRIYREAGHAPSSHKL